ncbi:hypothetical protein [Methylobacterium mesophilicum]|uniref:hypothetical protein n=1 Tax=Methylobacterium mesophilicum TaxID=39956 RepID=UPI003606E96C
MKKGGGDRKRGGKPSTDIPRSDAAAIKAKIARATTKPKPSGKSNSGTRRRADPACESPAGYCPPRGVTPPSPIPPSTPRERLLPLVSVGSRKFEELCEDLVEIAFPDTKRTSLKRVGGVEQYGVDVEGFDENGDPFVVVSVKCYRDIKAWDFKPWIVDFTKHLDGHWKGKGVRRFVLAISHECNDDAMNAAAKAVIDELRAQGIEFELWNTHRISRLAGRDLSIIDRYFSRYWTEAISAGLGTGSPVVAGPTNAAIGDPGMIAAAELLRQAAELASAGAGGVSDLMAARLEDAIAALRRGRVSELRIWLGEARSTDRLWAGLTPAIRAKALRATALLHLRDGETSVAGDLLDEADGVAAPIDASARAHLAWAEGRPDEALAMVAKPANSRELEARCAFLLEGGRAQEAVAALATATGDKITSEILRLRAIAAFIVGDRASAMQDASSALERAPDEIAPQMTLATIRLFSAMIEGVRPQFGWMPQPINPGLLRDDPDAATLLELAHEDFSRLLRLAEPPVRGHIEIWKLAALLLNPARREEGADLARELLKRSAPDPVAVAWAGNFGLVEKPGRITKLFGDMVRQDRGTVAHVIVLALLSAGVDRPKRGLDVIRRYESKFPDDGEFLADWKARFGDRSTDDATSYATVVQECLRGSDSSPLIVLLEDPGTTVEDVLTGAEFLAWRSAWDDLDRLRSRLLAMEAVRPRELAALAPLNAGRPAECLEVLEQIAADSAGGGLPRRFVAMRIRANEEMGRHRQIVDDLLSIRRAGDDPYIEGRLFEAYLRVGALNEVRNAATRILEGVDLAPDQALRIAYALRTYDAETARRALARAAELGIHPEAVGAAASLAADLGLSEVQDRMFRLLASADAEAGGHIRFDTVEEAVAFIDERSREYEARFEDWLRGAMPAVLAMQSDLAAYGRLFLAEPAERRNNRGNLFPMLLLSGARRSPAVWTEGERPVLRMDVSALLLASRLELLPELDRALTIRVPKSTAEALMEMQGEFRSVDHGIVEACRSSLSPAAGEVRVVRDVPEDAASIEVPDRAGELDPEVVAGLLDAAFCSGHLDRDAMEEARASLQVIDAGLGRRISSALLTPRIIYRLAAAGVLAPIARATPTFLSEEDATRIARELESAVHDDRLRDVLRALVATVSERLLADDGWTSLDRPEEDATQTVRMPAHLRCVMEVIGARRSAPEMFWVEERAFSHARMAGAVQIHDVIDRLHARGVIPTGRRTFLLRELRRLGYSFAPVDPASVAGRIEAASIDGQNVLETRELEEIRIWFANETRLLSHLDKTFQPSKDGEVVGEITRVLDHGNLVRSVLDRLWANRTATEAEKRARSRWAWICLRAGRIPGLPADAEPEARRYIHAVSLAHVVDLPLFADLSAEHGMEFDVRRQFMEWFVDEQLFATAKGDPATTDAVANILAGMLSELLERPTGVEGEIEEEVRRSFVKIALRLVILFPDDWSDRIVDRHDLRRKLDIKSGMVLHLGETIELEPDVLVDAYRAACDAEVSGGPATASFNLPDGSVGRFELAPPERSVRLATIGIGTETVRMDPVTSVLLDPDEDRRLAASGALHHLVDRRGWISPEDAAAAARHAAVDDRFAAFKALTDRDLQGSVTSLRSRLRETGTITLDALTLPSAEAVLGFIRMRLSDCLADAVKEAALRLDNELDIRTAASRLAASPFRLPDDLLRRWGALLCDPDEGRPRRSQSPLLAALRLRTLCIASAEETTIAAAANEFVEAVRLQGRLFAALLRHGAQAALHREDWRALDPAIRTLLLWIRADQLTRALAPATADADQLADWVQGCSAFDLADRRNRSFLPDWEIRLTFGLTPEILAASVVADMIREGSIERVPTASVEAFKVATGHVDGEAWLPSLAIVPIPSGAPEACWAGRDALGVLVGAGWLNPDHVFGAREDTTLADRLLEAAAAETDPAMRLLMPILLSLVDFARIDEHRRIRVAEAVTLAEQDPLVEPDQISMIRILNALSDATSKQDDVVAMTAALARQARRCAEKWPHERLRFRITDTDAARTMARFMDLAFQHADDLPRSGPDRMLAFAETVRSIIDAWPNGLAAAVGSLDAVARQIEFDEAVSIWPILIDLRGRTIP